MVTPTSIKENLNTIECKLSVRRNRSKKLFTNFSRDSPDHHKHKYKKSFKGNRRDTIRVKIKEEKLRIEKLNISVTERNSLLGQGLGNVRRELKVMKLEVVLPGGKPTEFPVVAVIGEPHFGADHDDLAVQA